MILFHWCRKINIYILKTLSFGVGGGQDKLAWTAYPPGVKIIRVGGKISREILPPGGQAVQGGKINCYTGSQGIFLHIPMGEHFIHQYAKNKKIPSWRFLPHPDLES